MLKLYKFRSLKDDDSKRLVKRILETGEFGCSSLWNLNDPMEGIFTDNGKMLPKKSLDEIFSKKNGKRICAFSSETAFRNPAMWGYYAHGFKGVAIEIEVDRKDVHEVHYNSNVAQWIVDNPQALSINQILTTKLDCWTHEEEWRYICDSEDDGSHWIEKRIGKVNAVHFGWPYSNVENARSIKAQVRKLKNYIQHVRELMAVASARRITTYAARIDGYKVISQPFNEHDIDSLETEALPATTGGVENGATAPILSRRNIGS